MAYDNYYDDEDEESEVHMGSYEGERDDEEARHGQGKAHHPNGDIYEGSYVRGKRQGKGCYTFAVGAKYDGGYFDGMKHGFGKMIFPDGSKYEGMWENGNKHGKGAYYYKNGDSYDGTWKDDKKHGIGVYKIAETFTTLKGNWDNGRLNGKVSIKYPAYSYHGEYVDGILLGKGKFKFELLKIEQTGSYVVEDADQKDMSSDHDMDEAERVKQPRWQSKDIRSIVPFTKRGSKYSLAKDEFDDDTLLEDMFNTDSNFDKESSQNHRRQTLSSGGAGGDGSIYDTNYGELMTGNEGPNNEVVDSNEAPNDDVMEGNEAPSDDV